MEFLTVTKADPSSNKLQRFLSRIADLELEGKTEHAAYIANAMRYLFGWPGHFSHHAGTSAGLI